MRELFIEIMIDNKLIDLGRYKAKFVGYEFTPSAFTAYEQESVKGIRMLFNKENISYQSDTGSITFLIDGSNHNEVDYLVRQLIGDLIEFECHISSQNYWRFFIANGMPEIQWIEYERQCAVTLTGICQCWSSPQQIKIVSNSQNILVTSPKETPISFKMFAKKNFKFIRINDIEIRNISAGQEIFVDSFNCRVTIDGKNAIDHVTLFNFPIVKGKYTVEVNDVSLVDLYAYWRDRL